MIQILLNSNRNFKKSLAAFTDFISFSISSYLVLLVNGVSLNSSVSFLYLEIIFFPSFSVLIFFLMGVYRSVLRYIDFSAIYIISVSIFLAVFLNSLIYYLTATIFFGALYSSLGDLSAQNIILILSMTFFFVIGSRLVAHLLFSNKASGKRVVIYGAGSAGIQLSEALRVSKEFQPVAFIDSNTTLQGTFIGGLKVLPPSRIRKMVLRNKIDEVLLAMPSAPKSTLRNLLKEIEKYSIKVRILPGLADLVQGKILVSELKEVDISDLLGRYEVEANQILINKNIQDKTVLITGAGGSIGSEVSRQVLRNKAKKVILLDANEYALYSIKNEIESYESDAEVYAILASVNNKRRIVDICKTFKVDTIYHAAAYKHVSLVEENPFEAVWNNIQGTKLCAEAALETNVDTFVLISTDKAVRPTNIMGATKRFAELILQSIASESKTRMIMVRFGNVIGSSGSAIPLFQQQIKEGGPVTVTHPEVIRYFMSIPEAAELVIQAGAMGKGGDVFVLDMGEPVKIYDLAKRLINLSGMEVKDLENPDGDIEIVITGLKPGEKLYEELLIGENVSTTEHKQILRAEEDFLAADELEIYLEAIEEASNRGDVRSLLDILQKVVSGFKPEEEIVDVVYRQRH